MNTEPTKTFIDEYGTKIEEWRDNEGRLHRDGTTSRETYWRDGKQYTPGVQDMKKSKLEKLEEQRKQLNARIQREKAKLNQQARKERTRRLIQVGEILESNLGIEFDEKRRNQLAHWLKQSWLEISHKDWLIRELNQHMPHEDYQGYKNTLPEKAHYNM
ncbi:hypothetical protein [Actinotignum urinale]|uniref:hypothetical protein n=1 Tax=Actinotignum urinale TaxID=190146 RepID=UPI00370D2EF4